MRENYEEITGLGGEVIAIGTGDQRYAADFVAKDHISFPVLVDDDAKAAQSVGLPRVNPFRLLFDPKSFKGGLRAHRAGYRVSKPGKRTNQLGATFVIGPNDTVLYEHIDTHTADHAPISEVVAALSV